MLVCKSLWQHRLHDSSLVAPTVLLGRATSGRGSATATVLVASESPAGGSLSSGARAMIAYIKTPTAEPIGIVISRGSREEAKPRLAAYVWGPVPEPVREESESKAA